MDFNNGMNFFHYKANAGYGVVFPAKSIIINAKEVFIISPGDFTEKEVKDIREITKTPIFIAPNNYHHLYLPKMQELFPSAKFYGPKRAQEQSKVTLLNTKDLDINLGLIPIQIQGNKLLGETCFYHEESKSLILTDLIFNMHHQMNMATKLMLTIAGTYHKLSMSRLVRMGIKDRPLFNKSILSLLEYPFEQVILNHGKNITRLEFEILIKKLKIT